jgi:thiamine biosynthesis lipoprotein
MSRQPILKRARPLLGTIVEIRVDTAKTQLDAGQAVSAAFNVIENVDRLMSFHRADSNLSWLNTAPPGTPVVLHPWTLRVLHQAQWLHCLSSGLFDPSVAIHLVKQGVLPAPLSSEPDEQASFFDLELRPDSTAVCHRRLWIDLGGIAKGFAVDLAVQTLFRGGVRAGCVSAGGDLRVFGKQEQPVFVRRPDSPSEMQLLGRVRSMAVATSGQYFAESFGLPADTKLIVDKERKASVPAYGSVSVIAPRCMWADALTKIVMLSGLNSTLTQHLLSHYRARAVVL